MSARWVLLLAILTMPAPSSVRAQAPTVPAASGRIHGTVLRSGTSEPVPGVAITLAPQATAEQLAAFRNASAGRGRTPREYLRLAHDGVTLLQEEFGGDPANPLSRPVVTDSDGRFAIENVPVGSYAVSAAREGYFGRGSDPETPGLFDGAAMSDMVLVTVERGKSATVGMELTPAAAISVQIGRASCRERV